MSGDGTFIIDRWAIRSDLPGADFHYVCPRFGAFTETVTWPGQAPLTGRSGPVLARLLALLHGVLGVSYYKCAAAHRIENRTAPDDPAAHAFLEAVYREGLGEFTVRNGLPYPYPLTVDYGGPGEGPAESVSGETVRRGGSQVLVGLGGGKDSHVAFDIAERAGAAPVFFKVHAHLGTASPRDHQGRIGFDRFLDPRLRQVNVEGALNGHVPVTAMNSLIAVIGAHLTGARDVIFANERSADEATAHIDGHGVNHQYSKTLALETLLAEALGPGAPRYFSLLRPVSELWIARHFAALTQHHDSFMSCNRNFRIGNEGRLVWCGTCPKCAFTFLLLAPFIARDRLVGIFGADLLERRDLMPTFEALTGLAPVKPWECVGTVEECRTIVLRFAGDRAWHDAAVIADLAPRLRAAAPDFDADAAWGRLMTPSEAHRVPEPYWSTLKALAAPSTELGVGR